jgi:general secretion pathway protein D
MVRLKLLVLFLTGAALTLPAYVDRGGGAYRKGQRAERHAELDAATEFYQQAHTLSPKNPKYFMAYTETRFKAASGHTRHAQLLLDAGELEEARKEFQKAVEIDPSNFLAEQELRLTADLIRRREEERNRPKREPPPKPSPEPSEAIELQAIPSEPMTFKITGDTISVYKTLAQMAGINAIFDPDLRPQPIKLDLSHVTLLQVLDMLGLQSKTSWRPVAANTILVTGNAANRKEAEQEFMKTFYLENVSNLGELQEAAGAVGKILDVDRVQLLPSQDALVARGTKEQLELAEKILADVDKPKSEVIVDVTVMEVDRERIRNLGAGLPTSTGITYLPGSTPSSSTSSGGSVTLGSFSISVPGGTLTALASDTNTKVIQNPQIRVLNDEKATLRIGDRVPIATGSFATSLAGGTVSPLISTQFQYLEVGVNIDITPHIHANHEVTLRMALEISSVTGENNIGGVTEPVIGQRKIEHEARLADGEVNLLAGILEDTETTSLSGYPWVSKIPLLKYLFAQDNKDHTESEIVFAITPHIVRGREISEENRRVVEVGAGDSTESRRKQPAQASRK